MKTTIQPTPAELEILDILWERKKATVREVFEELGKRKNTTYTTVL
jgi:predicted transcriptional regulator